MKLPATNSPLDVAYWFFSRAEKDGIYLETEKLHHLLFISQCRYAQMYNDEMLMPCLFLCDESGFFEPTIKRIFSQGRPFMPPVKFETQTGSFLESVWQDYGVLSLQQLLQIITKLPIYQKSFQKGAKTVVLWHSLVDKSNQCGTMQKVEGQHLSSKKVLVSQNGPVVVSQWTPRKIARIDNKGLL